jgi:CNT family concentrative nucleoside transporter
MDAAIVGALDGVKMAVSIAAVLILILGLVALINQIFGGLANLETSDNPLLVPIGQFFSIVNLQNILGVLFYPLTILTGVPLDESWTASVIIGRRLLETAIPPYRALADASKAGEVSDRTVLIVSYALSGFAHVASVGIFVGGTSALIPSRRRDISQLGWKALFIGTLATMMIACIAGVFDTGDPSILGEKAEPPAVTTPIAPDSPTPPTAKPSPTISPTVPVAPATSATPRPTPKATASPTQATPRPTPKATASPTQTTPRPTPRATAAPTQATPRPTPQATVTPSPSP